MAAAVAAAAGDSSKFHVLAVDDSLIDRKLIERLLRTSSFQVTTVESGSKALEFLGIHGDLHLPKNHAKEIEVNLIITDYCMPGMSGYDLLMRVKESKSLKDIPVIIMSSENVPSRINRCLEGGAEEFLLKPVQLSDMKRLRPHILKGRLKDQQQQNQQEEQVQNSTTTTNNKRNSNKKRKASDEEGLSPERTRPRYSSSSSNNSLAVCDVS